MDTRALRYFRVFAEYGSYSRGADWLRISQAAIIRQIRRPEEKVGKPLFRRYGHGVTLTAAGRVLLERAGTAFRALEAAKAEIRGAVAGPTGTVSLAVPPAAGRSLVPPRARGPRRLAGCRPHPEPGRFATDRRLRLLRGWSDDEQDDEQVFA